MDLDAYIALLQTADARIDRDNAIIMIDAAEDLADYAREIAHWQTGAMATSIHRLGPFPIGEGALELHIESGVDYADDEVSKGGAHDWASRTVSEQQARIDALAEAIENATVNVLLGGSE